MLATLDSRLAVVGQLVTQWTRDLGPVVENRVMRGRDHDSQTVAAASRGVGGSRRLWQSGGFGRGGAL